MTKTWHETRNMLHEAGIPLNRLGVNPQSSTLSGANLSWANLSGANLSGTDLTAANLSGVITHPANGE